MLCVVLDSFFVGVCEALGAVDSQGFEPNFCWIPVGPPVILAAVWTRNSSTGRANASREKLVHVTLATDDAVGSRVGASHGLQERAGRCLRRGATPR